MTDSPPPPLLRPLPRRPFQLPSWYSSEVSDSATSIPPRDSLTHQDERPNSRDDFLDGIKPESFSNPQPKDTSSTLFGIFSPAQNDSTMLYPSEPATPWGVGAETPAIRRSIDGNRPAWLEGMSPQDQDQNQEREQEPDHKSKITRRVKPSPLVSAGRAAILFALGVGYGALVSRLHDNQHIAPVHISGIDHSSWTYAAFWGVAGIAFASLLPHLDSWWRRTSTSTSTSTSKKKGAQQRQQQQDETNPADWTIAVRSIGAFVGIAFAIRKLPWQSTLQVSLTLALANPALWYLLDRTKPGLLLSVVVGTLGTFGLLLVNPNIVPSPASGHNGTMSSQHLHHDVGLQQGQAPWTDGRAVDDIILGGLLSYESVGVATWLGSVLFCSCICFGNIGRKMGI